MSAIEALQTLLRRLPRGPIEASQPAVECHLAAAWHLLDGSSDGGMQGEKLQGRMEQPAWSEPLLSFRIERHGATVGGSTRAEVQTWEIDLDHRRARLIHNTHRQLRTADRRLDVRAIAEKIAEAIGSSRQDPRINWRSTDCVEVHTAVAVPDAVRATTTDRRRRLRRLLSERLSAEGWVLRTGGARTVFDREPTS